MDNGSSDNSVKIARELAKGRLAVSLLPAQKNNIGFAAGYNAAMREAPGEYILLLNQDIALEREYLEKIINFMDNHEYAGAAIGKILRLTNGLKTRNIDTAGLRLFSSFRVTDAGSGEEDRGQFNGTEEIFGVSGCLPVYRSEALRQAGYFDSNFFSYKEDVDLAFRLRNIDWKAYRVGGAVAYHDRGLSGREQAGNREIVKRRQDRSLLKNYLSYRNHLYVLIKNVSWADWWRYGFFIFWYELKKLFYLLLFEQRTLYAWVEIIKYLPRFLRQRRKAELESMRKWIK